ncbi:chondroitin polymerizing factor [Choristoneura fumiferana]|uniref:chondroitin polymerizing factor n=1 Tax=Choristoneura fumiferana TaxID=7141 RepID=UPI003D15A64A
MLSRYVVSQVKHNSWFLIGVGLGLWLALAVVPLEEAPTCAAPAAPVISDEYEPQREERPDRASGVAGGRSIQRPRYYSTELGMRAPLLAGVLAAAAGPRAAALNTTARLLHPALKFFITAGSRQQASGGLANVVGFTDTREMLKPFHALKYLADNFLDEYDFFFLVSDATYINARRLTELVSRLSVSQDVYMGTRAEDDSHYCSLESGIILSNSVLRAVHGQLDWCVRNSYSPHHHENLGRCVLHAAHQACTPHLQVPTAPLSAPGPLRAARRAPGLHPPPAGTYCPPLSTWAAACCTPRTRPAPPTCRYLLPPSQHLGRCVLHAAHQACTPHLQGETYVSARLESPPQLTPALADAVTQHPASEPALLHQLHAYVSRVLLERDAGLVRALRAAVSVGTRRHPAGFRNATWPGGLRAEPGLAAPPPDSRFDHLRWTGFNATHAFMPSELKALAPLDTVHKEALDLVLQSACAWAQRRWGARAAALVEGAMRWEPATSLRYRLLLRLTARDGDDAQNVPMLRQVEVVRLLGAARLVPVPYVTESARLHLVLPVLAAAVDDAAAFLRRYEAVCLQKDKNTDLIIVLVSEDASQPPFASDLRAAAAALANKYRTTADVLTAVLAPGAATEEVSLSRAARAACDAALARLPRDSLLVLADPRMEFNEDFLNRARMNSISGVQWYLPRAFGRFATYAHPRALQPDGSRPQHHTGRFTQRRPVAAFYRGDYAQALAEWSASGGSPDASVADILAGGAVRCLRAPEPGLVLQPPPPPCQGDERLACLTKLREAGEFDYLELGAKHALAKLLLEEQAERER